MRRHAGITVLTWDGRVAMRPRSQYLPRYGEKRVIIERRGRWYLAHWLSRAGYRITQWGPVGLPPEAVTLADCHDVEDARMKRRTPAEAGLPAVPLDASSKLFGKLSLVCEFLTSTAYDDGTPRTPGYVTWRNRGGSFEITAYDPDAGLRCAVRHMTIDGAWAALDVLIGATEAPWEIDQYLTDQLLKKKKRRA